MNIEKAKVIFFNTIQKELRNKVFLFLFVLTLFGILATTAISHYLFKEVVPTEATAIFGDKTLDLIFVIIHFWTLMVGIILGSNCIKSDFENNNIISQLISLPIKRAEYLIARILGTWAITCFYYVFSYLVGLVSFSLVAENFVGSASILPAFALTSLSALGMICISVFLSFLLPKIFTFVMSFISYLFITYANAAMRGNSFEAVAENLGVGNFLALVGQYLFPRVGDINTISHTLLMGGELPEQINIGMTLGHFFLSFGFLFFVLSFFFKRKDI